nr:tyrosine-type recombinase/integrase [Ornithinimicrobium sediminis]
MYAPYVLLLVLGLRRGEVFGLAWKDVDLERGEAYIAWRVQRVDGRLLRRRTRTPSSDAPLPLPDIAVQALERHRADEDRRRIAAGDMWGDCGLVFTTRLGDPVDPRNFHTAFKTRARKAGVPLVPVHATRRTCASLLVSLDVHPRVAMAVLRHSRIALTMGSTPKSRPTPRATPCANSAGGWGRPQPGKRERARQCLPAAAGRHWLWEKFRACRARLTVPRPSRVDVEEPLLDRGQEEPTGLASSTGSDGPAGRHPDSKATRISSRRPKSLGQAPTLVSRMNSAIRSSLDPGHLSFNSSTRC